MCVGYCTDPYGINGVLYTGEKGKPRESFSVCIVSIRFDDPNLYGAGSAAPPD